METSNYIRQFETSHGTLIYTPSDEIILITKADTFVGKVTSRGIYAQANRFSRKTKSEIAKLLTDAHNEVKKIIENSK